MELYKKQDVLQAFERALIDASWDGSALSYDGFANALDFTPSFIQETGEWIWDPDGIDCGIGAWRCSACKSKNANLFSAPPKNPMRCSGSKYCPNCGRKMSYNSLNEE